MTTGVNTRMVIIDKTGTAVEPLASLKEGTVQPSDATPVTVVEVEPGIVPEFKKMVILSNGLKIFQ